MDTFAIPVEGKFILYRPLRRLAFVGNRAMADLALGSVRRFASGDAQELPPSTSGAAEEAMAFLQAIGFLEPDPAPPPPPSPAYLPTTAVLLLTNRCNLRCSYCYANGGEGPVQDLSTEMAQVVIDQAHQNAVELSRPSFELTFHGGGEPLQAWDVLQNATLYARSKDLRCHVSMVSNGICSAGQREWLVHNLDSLSISFDGAQTTQDRQRPLASGRGSFKAVMRTIKALDRASFSYGIRMTAMAPWRERLPEDIRFICENTGCPAMQVEPAFNTCRGGHRGPTREESEAFADGFMDAYEIARRAGRQLTYSGARPWLLTHTFCTAPHGALIVNAAAELVACYEIAGDTHLLAEMSTVGRVSDGQVVVDDQTQMALWNYLERKRANCRDCFCYWHCAGDCFTRAQATDDSEEPSPRCHMNREITARILLWNIKNSDGVWQGQRMSPQSARLMRTF